MRAARDDEAHGLALRGLFTAELGRELGAIAWDVCCHGRALPLGAGHVQIFATVCAVRFTPQELAKLSAAYELALGQAYLVDDLADDQTVGIGGRILTALRELELSLVLDVYGWPAASTIFSWGRTQDRALRDEFALALDDSGLNSIGRAAPVFAYFELVASRSTQSSIGQVRNLLRRYIVVAQRCDDIADWESDLLLGRMTTTARTFVSQAGISQYSPADYTKVLRTVYLCGSLRAELGEVTEELRRIRAALSTIEGSDSFADVVDNLLWRAAHNLSAVAP